MSHCLSLFDILIAVPFFTKVASVFSHVHNVACVNVYRLKYRWRCQHAGIFPPVTPLNISFFPPFKCRKEKMKFEKCLYVT